MEWDNGTPTLVRGAGKIVSDIATVSTPNGGGGFNFLVRTDDGNVVRLQFWDDSVDKIRERCGSLNPKGLRIGFKGRLAGTYQEKPTVQTSVEEIRFS